MIKKLFVALLLAACFILPASAEETDLYKEQLEGSGVNELYDYIPDQTKDYLNDFNIDLNDSGWVNKLSDQNALLHIWDFIKSGASAPLKAFFIILALIFLASVTENSTLGGGEVHISFIMLLSVAAALLSPIYSVITASVDTLKGCAYFMTAFIPVFAVIIAASGKTLTSVSSSGILLIASNFVTYIANFTVIPLMSGYLSLSVASSVSPLMQKTNLAESFKKISLWVMSFISTLFIGILSIQTIVNSSADNLTMKTAKFIVGSTVPVAGGVLSEALSTVTASLSLLKSSVGIWGVFVCGLTFLPLIVELLLWRISLFSLCFFSEIFSLSKISSLLKSVDSVLEVLIGIVLLSLSIFTISLTVVLLGGKGV